MKLKKKKLPEKIFATCIRDKELVSPSKKKKNRPVESGQRKCMHGLISKENKARPFTLTNKET